MNRHTPSPASAKPKLILAAILSLTGSALSVQTVNVQAAEQVASQATGLVQLYALQQGLPKSGVEVFLGEKRLGKTDADGAFSIRLPAGTQTLTLKSKQNVLTTLKIKVAKDDDLELIIPITQQAKVSQILAESAKVDTPIVPDKPKADEQADEDLVQVEGEPEILSIIRGTIYSLESGEGVPDANVYLTGVSQQIVTDGEGFFEVKVPIGNYALSVVHPDYSATTIKGLTLKEGEALDQELELTPAAAELEEFIVSAPALEGGMLALMAEKQNSGGVSEVLSSEEFARSGDSSAAGALSRVTGLTLVGGKYIYVRGMGDRYSATRLNGAGLPSPEPSKRVVPLDMFPTGMIGSIVVQKSYSPDLPGEFGGGTVLLRTKPIPLEKHRKFSLSTGGNSLTTFQDRETDSGSGTDFLGFDDGSRDIPSIAKQFPEMEFSRRSKQDDAILAQIAQELPKNYDVGPQQMLPDAGLSFELGDRYESYDGHSGWGYNIAFNYSKKSRYYEEALESFDLDSATISPEENRKFRTKLSTNIGVMGSFIYEQGENHKYDATTIVARSSADTVNVKTQYTSDNGRNTRQTSIQWEERQLLSQQFHGKHVFPEQDDLAMEWQYTLSQATRTSPDTRFYEYFQSATLDENGELGDYSLSGGSEGNTRTWEYLDDTAQSFTYDVTQPIYDWQGLSGQFKAGLSLETKDRKSDVYKYSFDLPLTADTTGSLESILADENLEQWDTTDPESPVQTANGATTEDLTQATDSYTASQTFKAVYAMTELNLHKYLKTMFGARFETSNQTIQVYNNATRTEKQKDVLQKDFLLPAINFTIPYQKSEQVRIGYSKTINRPDLKELSQSTYIDPDTRDYYIGNPDLKIATIANIDLRWEKYLNNFENISVAFFSKEFIDPIEVVAKPSVSEGGLTTYSYSNATSALNQGIEFQSRFWLRRIFGRQAPALYLDSNFTLIQSQIDMSGIENNLNTNDKRALQGQAPWVVNLNLGYENLVKEINANLLLNMQGDVITKAGTKISPDAETGVEDTYLQSPASLNFVYSQRIYWGAEDKAKIKLKINNLLDGQFKEVVNNSVTKSYKKGLSFALSVNYTWK